MQQEHNNHFNNIWDKSNDLLSSVRAGSTLVSKQLWAVAKVICGELFWLKREIEELKREVETLKQTLAQFP